MLRLLSRVSSRYIAHQHPVTKSVSGVLPRYFVTISSPKFSQHQNHNDDSHNDFVPIAKSSSSKSPTSIFDQIKQDIAADKVVLFMKGTAQAPQCGFSNAVVQVLKKEKIPFSAHNVLADSELREGIKKFSNWPTIPQLYVNGEFVGGCDIVLNLHKDGELQTMLQQAGVVPKQ